MPVVRQARDAVGKLRNAQAGSEARRMLVAACASANSTARQSAVAALGEQA